jgi:hypothetical protein
LAAEVVVERKIQTHRLVKALVVVQAAAVEVLPLVVRLKHMLVVLEHQVKVLLVAMVTISQISNQMAVVVVAQEP